MATKSATKMFLRNSVKRQSILDDVFEAYTVAQLRFS